MSRVREYIPSESEIPWWKKGSDTRLRQRIAQMSDGEVEDLQATIKATITDIQAQLENPEAYDGDWKKRARYAKSLCTRRMSVVKQELVARNRNNQISNDIRRQEYSDDLGDLLALAKKGDTENALVGLLETLLQRNAFRREKIRKPEGS